MTESDHPSHGRAHSTRYTLLEKLGAGGQAEVWRARDNESGAEVALKVLNPQLARDEGAWTALTREQAIASRMDHPAILKVYPPYREGDFVALPMELAPGGDLRRLRGKSYLDVIPVLIEIAQGLEYAHEHGVIHRDLKPGNVLFDARGAVRLADFGIAGAPGEVNPSVVRPGLSPFTASPEQLRGDPPAISDDIYGLGALAYELLSGYPPYYPRFEVKRALDEPVPELKPAQIMPHQLSTAIMRMLSKRASQRQRSMREVIDEFDAALNDTLTFNYDRPDEQEDAVSASMRRDAAVLAAAEAAKRSASLAQSVTPNEARAAPPPAASSTTRTSRSVERRAPDNRADERPAADSATRVRSPPSDDFDEDLRVTGARPRRAAPSTPAPASPSARASEPSSSHADSTTGLRRKYRDQPAIAAQAAALLQAHDMGEQDAEDDYVAVDSGPARPTNAGTVEVERIAAAAAAVRAAAPDLVTAHAPPTYWDDTRLRADRTPLRQRRPPRKSWPWVLLTAVAAAALLVFVVLPKYGSIEAFANSAISDARSMLGLDAAPATEPAGTDSTGAEPDGSQPVTDSGPSIPDALPASVAASGESLPARASTAPAPIEQPSAPAEQPAAITPEALGEARDAFEQRLAALEKRGAGSWGGPEFAAAKTRAAEAVGANDAGSPQLAEKRLQEAVRLLSVVEARANPSLASQIAAGEKALAAGQGEVAKQAFESALRIDSGNRRAQEGLQRVRNLGGVLPLLADGENAEAANDFARAVQDYSQALSLDPNNAKAKAGLARAHAAFGEDSYAKAVGAGFASLGAGRLEDARVAFEKARSIRPNGPEAATGLSRVGAALSARGFASTRQRGSSLEAEERWTEAAAEYDAALKVDPSLVFAQQGKARALARAELNDSLQALIERPERLASQAVRAEADTLIKRAAVQEPTGPVLRSQIARLQILLPGFDTPVRVEMLSDNATQVQIQRVGTFGAFDKREIELKPGKYTVVGTRPGFRDVRRDVTIAPGGDVQTISVSCVEPI
jgi:serine/threonine protein kinase/tetratricopeptide (TPR) repeat protein